MRRFVGPLFFVGSVAVAAPLVATPAAEETPATGPAPSPVAVQQVRVSLPGVRDEVAMVLVGTALIGLGAAVRRTAN